MKFLSLQDTPMKDQTIAQQISSNFSSSIHKENTNSEIETNMKVDLKNMNMSKKMKRRMTMANKMNVNQ